MARPSQDTLERLADRAMPGFERGHVGGWVMRAALGATRRANTVWPAGRPGCELDEAVDRVESWYRQRGLRPGFQIYEGHGGGLEDELGRRGYVERPGALLLWTPLADLRLDAGPPQLDGREVRLSSEPPEDFAALIGEPDRVAENARCELPQCFATVHDRTGALLGGGRSTLDGEHLGLFSLLTAERARRQGVAQQVLRALVDGAHRQGAQSAWLQTMVANTAARTLSERMGFRPVHRYDYLFAAP